MKLSIITITKDNIAGLKNTIESVGRQSWHDYELIVIDGASNDGTVQWLTDNKIPQMHCISEPDKGVYDAQNKGIRKASGDYCLFLNAGDVFASDDVLSKVFADDPTDDIIYGNEIVVDIDGNIDGVAKGVENPSGLDIYKSCMKHQATFISRSLFDKYGMYDAELRIVADFEWFLRVLMFHDDVTLRYVDVDVSRFNNDGISYHHPELCAKERQLVLDRHLSRRQQRDYELLGKLHNFRGLLNYNFIYKLVAKLFR